MVDFLHSTLTYKVRDCTLYSLSAQ